MRYRWGKRSRSRLAGVDADIVTVCERLIEVTRQDLTIGEGLRSRERQAMLVRTGKSRTMNSKHLIGEAVDIWPLRDGAVPWNDLDVWYDMAVDMRAASLDTGVRLVWGARWGVPLDNLDVDDLEAQVQMYRQEYRRAHGRYPLFDCPHFELYLSRDDT